MLLRNSISIVLCCFILSGCFGERGNQKNRIKNPLRIERLYSSPKIDGELPKSIKIAPDGRRIAYLKGKGDDFRTLDLWVWDVNAGAEKLLVDSIKTLGSDKEELSDEEKARRERKRESHGGIVEFHWSEQGDKILFPLNGDLYLYDLGAEKPLSRLTQTEEAELDASFSPKGNYVSFVRNHNLHIIDLATKQESPVTFAGTKEKPMAVAEFVAQEEMSRYRGYWWSPDESFVALTQVDETPVGLMTRLEAYPSGMKVVEQRYPQTGGVNAIVRLGVVKLFEKGVQWVKLSLEDYYIPHVQWLDKEKNPSLTFMLQARNQQQLDLIEYDPVTKKQKVLITEKDRAWVDIRHDNIYLKKQNRILWLSEKSGYHHIHVYDLDGKEQTPLTSGAWEVTELLAVDEEKGKVYFSATKDSPLEQHLYVVDLKGGEPVKVTKGQGIHEVSMAKKPSLFVDRFSSQEQPPQTVVHDMDGKVLFSLAKNKVEKNHPLAKYIDDFSEWEFGTVKREGTELHYKLLRPKGFDPGKKYPLIHYVYGGPGVQLVHQGWPTRAGLFHQLLAQKGFVVLVSDNRGTPNRGRDFEREYYLKFGRLEVEDQAEVLKYILKKNTYIDEKRVGVYGHSYGGYLTLMLLFQRPDLYHVGVSGAPVVDWKLYDTHYTERFLGHPKQNEAFYLKSNVLTYANSFRGRLLVLHGMADDNVLYNHSLLLYQELQNKGKVFDIMAYPGAKHSIRGKEQEIHYASSILQYFTDHLVKGI